ncbi:MAG: hypothetical protein LUO95_07210 [Methylococcaceae bacterium]|nr:hypothetical protein [Methylococcaceae bacterium]MDD1608812.1 hypothetical protein [Methylococcaceae bacterium]MDD1610382.1 hypothetical protein [Methylococcaceae bacterium]MDD1616181.1 hypothetical protein [Methylococcaceae bacterium]
MIKPKKSKTVAKHDADNPPLFKGDMLAKAIVISVSVSIINHTGKAVFKSLARHSLIVFGLGVTTGYFAHKYRKRLIKAGNQAADESKQFVLRQRENLLDLLAENQDDAEDQEH